jgi:two-component system, OmpR family, sensor histidine kinase KdpD
MSGSNPEAEVVTRSIGTGVPGFDDSLPPINMDLRRIEEVLSKLLDNAAKYSPPGTQITISAEKLGSMVVASVADQGPGIDGIDQGMVFDKFFRGRGQRYSVKGTGMPCHRKSDH